MDTEAILRRKPALAVVDEFAHSNVPGSKNTKRWQDVHELLDAGINVLTTMNVQHLESLNDQVWHFTGVRVRETIPDWVVDEADEVVLVDLTPRALRNRIERGVVYSAEKARRALDNFFAEANLTALRELAIRHTAHEVEEKLTEPRRDERILICLTGSPYVGQPDPPRQAYGGLPASRLSGRPHITHFRRRRNRRAPHELRAQPAHPDIRPTRGGRTA